MRRTFIVSVLAASLLLALVAGPAAARPARPAGPPTIASTAIANGNFDTLVTALVCTDLVGLVSDPRNNLTVFAPTDAAFAKANLNPGNVCPESAAGKAALADILADHVVAGRYPSGRVLVNESLTAVSGRNLTVQGDLLPKLNLDLLDLQTSNGVIHVLNEVILPAS